MWKELSRSQDGDSLLFSLLALLARELRLLWQLWAGEKVRVHPNEAAFKKQLATRLARQCWPNACLQLWMRNYR